MQQNIKKQAYQPFFNAVAALATALTLTTPSLAFAEDAGKGILHGSASNVNEAFPTTLESASLGLPDGRNITIHREALVNGQRSNAIYFHRPLFAFVKNPDAETQSHPIIWDQIEYEDHVYLGMKLVLSTPEFRELARGAVIEEDSLIRVEKPEIQERDIDVRAWPLTLLRFQARHSLVGKEYGVSLPDSLRTSGDEIEISMKIPISEYPEFLSTLQNDRIKFSPSYTFSNAIVAFAQSATKISSEVSVAIDNALQSAQIEEGTPIFQKDAKRLRNVLRQSIVTTIRATDSAVLAHISPQDISGQILRPETTTFSDIEGNKELLEKVSAYLTPIIRKMSAENTTTDENNETTTDTKTKSIGLGYGAVGFSGEVKLSDEQIKTLEKKHNVVFKETEDKDIIEPHSIDISYIRESWQDSLVDIFQTIYLATGRNNTFQTDSSIRANFTADKLQGDIDANRIIVSPYNRVPKGIPMLSFRADVPKGWIALDGSTNWPKENWVQKHLRGKPVPDMRGAFARGAKNTAEVGLVREGGKITVDKKNIEIQGSSFNLANKLTVGTLHRYKRRDKGLFTVKNNLGRGNNSDTESFSPTNIPRNIDGTVSFNIEGFTLDLGADEAQPKHALGQWIMRLE